MFCALLGHTGERLQTHWSSGFFLCFFFFLGGGGGVLIASVHDLCILFTRII